MAMSRSLGEGKITKLVKKYAYIFDERLGNVYFPLTAACIGSNDCYDLRDKFGNEDHVVFTAQKQPAIQNQCHYVASSVVKKRELIVVSGKISETCEKFCYADVKKYGRVFVPYSARSEANKAWLGKGAEKGKEVSLRIFRQPDINQCKYVAWGISLNDSDDSVKIGNSNMVRPVDKSLDTNSVSEQLGVIVSHPPNGDSLIYSAHTGLARLPVSLRKSWMDLGRFVRYDVIKQSTEVGKVNWIANNCVDLGTLFKVIDDNMDETKLHLEVHAVVNRVSTSGSCRAAWLWNDFIGRIYIPPACFVRGLRAMTCVKIRALYTGAFEDVPWSALTIELLGDDEVVRLANAQLLRTDDDWTVTTVKFVPPQLNSFYGFMDNPKYGSAFIAWTDLTDGDSPPPAGTKCRATVYHQQRDRKHAWRAVLVTPLGADGQPVAPHPVYEHSGNSTLPEPYDPPHIPHQNGNSLSSSSSTLQLASQKSASALSMTPVQAALPSPIAAPIRSNAWGTNSSRVSPVLTNDSLHSNGISSAHITNDYVGGMGPRLQPMPSPPLSQASPAPRILSSDSSDAYSDLTNGGLGELDLTVFGISQWARNGTGPGDFLPWAPISECFTPSANNTPFPSVPVGPSTDDEETLQMAAPGSGRFPFGGTREVGSQTEAFSEQLVLTDVLRNPEIILSIMRSFPEHTERIMGMKSAWK